MLKFFYFALLCLSINAFANNSTYLPKYYPEKFQKDFERKNIINIKERIYNILNSIHQKNINQTDTLVLKCSKQKKCYQANFQRSYKKTRQLLFGHIFFKKRLFSQKNISLY